MITSFDDYLIHQSAAPITLPSQSDRNFYDRHWMAGFDAGGELFFEVGMGIYPNRRVLDAHLSFVVGDKQHALHGSRRAPKDRRESQVGPLRIEIEEPLRTLRVVADENEHGISCDLQFIASSIAHREPDNVMYDDGRLIMHNARYTQAGSWQGHITVDGVRHELSASMGFRDRSWGVRPVGEPEGGAPGLTNGEPGVFWCWTPLLIGSNWYHYCTFQDRDGNPTQVSMETVPVYDSLDKIPSGEDPAILEMSQMRHQLNWHKGTRLSSGGKLNWCDPQGAEQEITLEPFGKPHYMKGLGYQHPDWGHAFWKGELVTGREDWDLNSIAPLELPHIHTHQRVKARMGSEVGFGILETIVIGRHEPSGFKDFFDGAQ